MKTVKMDVSFIEQYEFLMLVYGQVRERMMRLNYLWLGLPLAASFILSSAGESLPNQPIRIRRNTIVCISAIVFSSNENTRLKWSATDRSASISSRMAEFYNRSGGTNSIETVSGLSSRFVYSGSIPDIACHQPSAIRIDIKYRALANGHPYEARFTLEQGSAHKDGSFSKDLNPTGDRFVIDPVPYRFDLELSENANQLLKIITDI